MLNFGAKKKTLIDFFKDLNFSDYLAKLFVNNKDKLMHENLLNYLLFTC